MRRHVFYTHCWVIAILAAAGLSWGAVQLYHGSDLGTLLAVTITAPFGFCYFAHQQKLAEIKLLKKLFTDFNGRYDRLHKRLSALQGRTEPLLKEEEQTVLAYFNLCAEEYLFRSEDYIPDTVWRSWCRGMLEYLNQEPFKSRFETECAKDCYYGMDKVKIVEGASLESQKASVPGGSTQSQASPAGIPVVSTT